MFRIHYTNLDYFAEYRFTTAEAALDHGKGVCFDFTVRESDHAVCSWSPIGGLRVYREEYEYLYRR